MTSDIKSSVSSLLHESGTHAISPVTLTRPCAITLRLNVSRQPLKHMYVTPILSLRDGKPGDVTHYHIHTKQVCIIALLVSVTHTHSEECRYLYESITYMIT